MTKKTTAKKPVAMKAPAKKSATKKEQAITTDLQAILEENPGSNVCVSLIILDRSGSMSEFCQTDQVPKDVINKHIQGLKDREDSWIHCVCVLTFSDDYRIDIPLCQVSKTSGIEKYSPNGMTLLYSTVYHGIEILLNQFNILTEEQKEAVKVVVSIITDGRDNQSDGNKYPEQLQKIAKETLGLGWDFLTFGIGFDGQDQAKCMGLPYDDDHAFTYERRRESLEQVHQQVHDSTDKVTMVVSGDGSGFFRSNN